jgi:hypothetical protein
MSSIEASNCLVRRVLSAVFLVIVAAGSGGSARAEAADARGEQLDGDLFVIASEARLSTPVPGDALVAAAEVRVDAPVGGDAALVGRRVQLFEPVADDLYAAGRELELWSTVGGNARIAAASMQLGPKASVAGALTIAAGAVAIDGHVGRYLQIAGETVTIDGTVDGDIHVAATELRLGPSALVKGAIEYRGPRPVTVDPAARVSGGVHEQLASGDPGTSGALAWLLLLGVIAWFVGWIAVGLAWWTLWPRSLEGAKAIMHARPTAALIAGLVVLAGVPAAVMALFVSGVGAPLSLLLLLVYLIAIPLGYLSCAVHGADWLLERTRPSRARAWWLRSAALGAAMLLMTTLSTLPLIGPLVAMLLTAAGLGSLILWLDERRSSATGPSAASSSRADSAERAAAPALEGERA